MPKTSDLSLREALMSMHWSPKHAEAIEKIFNLSGYIRTMNCSPIVIASMLDSILDGKP